nr:ribonuclease J [Nanchangia anserum]
MYPDLTPPPPADPDSLRVVPLGGLGEVGRNMTVMEHRGKILLLDCGVLFPEEIQPGVDLILPDFSYIAQRMDDVTALLLTHGHEDHIGAVPYLLRLREDIPIYGSKLTIAFLEAKLREHRLPTTHLHVVAEGDAIELDGYGCEFLAVNHSIPDALAIMIRTAAGNALLTGDFKMDQLPLDGRITDLRGFARMGDEGVDLFMVDSTNAEVPGFVTSECEIGPVLKQVFRDAQRQIVVASFASHVHRVQQVLGAAAATGRKVCLIGRSMERNMRIAAEGGYLNIPEGILVDQREARDLPPECRVYMATGSQGEPMAALSRMAQQNHRTVELAETDTVVLASSLIPGNENSVYRVINALMRLGVHVVHRDNAKVHVSGHAAAGELLYAYNIIQPRNVMPMHGEIRHLIANGSLAVRTGVDPDRVALAEDGVVVDLIDRRAHIVGQVPCEYVYVDGRSIGEIGEGQLKDRLTLGEEGFVSIFAAVDAESGHLIAGPHITARGMAEDDAVFREVLGDVTTALANAAEPGNVDTYKMQQAARRALGRWIARRLRRRPMIVPVVVEV